MIAELLNRGVVTNELIALRDHVAREKGEHILKGESTAEDDVLLAELEKAVAAAPSSGPHSFDPPESDRRGAAPGPVPIDDLAFISSDAVISLVQSAVEEYVDLTRPVQSYPAPDDRRGNSAQAVTDRFLGLRAQRDAPEDRRLFEQFSITDPGWIRSKVAEGIRLLQGKHPFNTEPAQPCQFPSQCRFIVVGDWGSGLPRAQLVAKRMRLEIESTETPVHVIHLGDCYYSGWGHEYQNRFLPYWPVNCDEGDRIGSWSLNGNHDMYSGGYGYFGDLLGNSRFAKWQSDARGRPSSFFSLVNDDWKVLGLDTGYEDGGLEGPQPQWLVDELKSAGGRKTLLLSHHQFFSSYEKCGGKLIEKATPILNAHPVTAWFWGHEHRSMVFAPYHDVQYARCVGDGGVPVYQWHEPKDPYTPPGKYEHRRSFQTGLERWALMGFAVMDFHGPRIKVRYIDETGHAHQAEEIS